MFALHVQIFGQGEGKRMEVDRRRTRRGENEREMKRARERAVGKDEAYPGLMFRASQTGPKVS